MSPELPRVLFLHGFLSGSVSWRAVLAEMGDGVEAFAPDLLGYGAERHGRGAYGLDAVLDHLAPLVDRLRPDYVVGHSMGAIVGMALAIRNPGAFTRLGIIGLPVYEDRRDALAYLRHRGLVQRAVLQADDLAHIGCRLVHRTRRLWLPFSDRLAPGYPRDVLATLFSHSPASHAGGLGQIVFAGLVPELAARVATPVVALHGGRDTAAPLDRARSLALEHGWAFQLAPAGNHQIPVLRPRLTAAWVREHVLGMGTGVVTDHDTAIASVGR